MLFFTFNFAAGINRPGVAGAVLRTFLSLIQLFNNLVNDHYPPNLHNTPNLKTLELGT